MKKNYCLRFIPCNRRKLCRSENNYSQGASSKWYYQPCYMIHDAEELYGFAAKFSKASKGCVLNARGLFL